ncbi:hypothetical protein CDD81_5406 [Ophiocordyceps australis]|uniref:Zn(2)-C6 fungal-type domain-containing protein n=1 Tax=Ophiocordyceps australis TaxID=1399860 RepID=A0A2C5XA32_9HYPO|nr:hypothetical protein CDD81_5406 [Ophiocordyceps australis]
MASKHPLRRSCAFCRARKIKCSNETICEACRRQGADCIYDFDPPRPKVRTVSQDSMRSGDAFNPACNRHRQRSSTGSSRGSPIVGAICDEAVLVDEADGVAHVLEQDFFKLNAALGARRMQSEGGWTGQLGARRRQMGVLSLVTHSIVELVTEQLGGAASRSDVDDGASRFSMASDFPASKKRPTCCMFEADDEADVAGEATSPQSRARAGSNPLSEYGQRQLTQLIDVWFSTHPLSMLVSKTLLLRELRDGTYDEVLLAAMLVDAHASLGDDASLSRSRALLRWTRAQLRLRPVSLRSASVAAAAAAAAAAAGDGPTSAPISVPASVPVPSCAASLNSAPATCILSRTPTGVATRVFGGISTAQALVLLGWSALSAGQLRRGLCFVRLAGRIAQEIKEHMTLSAHGPLSASSRINGVDVLDVEKEVVAYLYWTTFSLGLWASLQLGGRGNSATQLLAKATAAVSLPLTDAESTMIKLDLVSDNFSTLQWQKAAIRDMWPLAHIASTVAYIVALYPADGDGRDGAVSGSLWRLTQAKASREIHRLLVESTRIFRHQVAESPSQSLVLLAHHTMATHFFFSGHVLSEGEGCVSREMVDCLYASTKEIQRLYSLYAEQQTQSSRALVISCCSSSSLSSSLAFPALCHLALQTCARALGLVCGSRGPRVKRKRPGGGHEAPLLARHEHQRPLQEVGATLYDMCHGDVLNQGQSLAKVRKQLKASLRSLDNALRPGSHSSSSGMPSSPETGALGPSLPPYSPPPPPLHSPDLISPCESDRMSTATTFAGFDAAARAQVSFAHSPCVDPLPPSADALAEPMMLSSMAPLQPPAWCVAMPGVMDLDLDMAASVTGGHWDWAALGLDHLDSMLYYSEGGHSKTPC